MTRRGIEIAKSERVRKTYEKMLIEIFSAVRFAMFLIYIQPGVIFGEEK